MTDNSGPGGSQLYYDVDTFEEVQIEMNSHSAEVQTRGDQIQSDSVDEDLRSRGVDRASSLDQYLDTGLDLGGPIARDRVWFWGALRGQEIERFVTGTRNPDGSFPIDRTFLWYPSAKIDRRAADAHRVSGFFNMQQKKRFNRGLSAPRPLETTVNQMNNPISRLVSLRDDWTMSPRLLISLKANYLMGAFQTRALPGVDTANTPARLELSINAWSEAPPSTITSGRETWTVGGTGNYSASGWGGTHDVKFGVEFNRMEAPVEFGYPADHRLRFLDGQPLEVWLFSPGRQNSVVHARSGEVNVPAGAAVVDAAGKWLIPGLMNMHVHLGLALPGRAGSELAGETRSGSASLAGPVAPAGWGLAGYPRRGGSVWRLTRRSTAL